MPGVHPRNTSYSNTARISLSTIGQRRLVSGEQRRTDALHSTEADIARGRAQDPHKRAAISVPPLHVLQRDARAAGRMS